jgi:hypothetical protein
LRRKHKVSDFLDLAGTNVPAAECLGLSRLADRRPYEPPASHLRCESQGELHEMVNEPHDWIESAPELRVAVAGVDSVDDERR